MGRSPCCSKEGLNRGAWTTIEDRILADYIKNNGEGRWRNLPKKAGLKRCGKSCRLRWMNYLRPDIKRGNISHDEEELILRLHRLLGNRWSLIAGRLPGRTDNEIKNYWNTNLGKKIQGHPTSSSSRKNSNQSIYKKKPELRPTSPKFESLVVRTKALRCTKPVLTPHEPDRVEHIDTNAAIGPSMVRGTVEAESCDGLSSFTPQEDNSSDFIMDLCLDNFLDADFSQLCDFDNAILGAGSNNKNNDSSPSTDQPLLFSGEMMKNWRGIDSFQADFDIDLPSLAHILESEDDWRGE